MATNNFLIFDQQQQNIMSDQAYSTNQQRLSGVTQGIASSQLHNKQAYQASVMSNAIAQLINAYNLDASDASATQLYQNLSSALAQLSQANGPQVTFVNYSSPSAAVINEATPLAQDTYSMAGGANSNYAIFAGGRDTNPENEVYAYNSDFTQTTATSLSIARYDLEGATVSDYVLFADGTSSGGGSSVVDAYDSSLTHSTPATDTPRTDFAGTSVGDYALFGGGTASSDLSTVSAYNSSLVRSVATPLSTARKYLGGASTTDYAIFAGGLANYASNGTVDAYTTSLVHSNLTTITANYGFGCASSPNYAVFAGGNGVSWGVAYSNSLVRTSVSLASAATSNSGTYAQGCYVFDSGTDSTTVTVLNSDLVSIDSVDRSAALGLTASASIGGAALFAGGYLSSSRGGVDTVYKVSFETSISVPAWWSYKFDSQSSEQFAGPLGATYQSSNPINGYMKPANITLTGSQN